MDHEQDSGCTDSARDQHHQQTIKHGAAHAAADGSWRWKPDRVGGAPELHNRNEISVGEAVRHEFNWFWSLWKNRPSGTQELDPLRGPDGGAGEDQNGSLAVGARGDAWRKLGLVPWALTSKEWRQRSDLFCPHFLAMAQMDPTRFAEEFAESGAPAERSGLCAEHIVAIMLSQKQIRSEMQHIQQCGLGWGQQAQYLQQQLPQVPQQLPQVQQVEWQLSQEPQEQQVTQRAGPDATGLLQQR